MHIARTRAGSRWRAMHVTRWRLPQSDKSARFPRRRPPRLNSSAARSADARSTLYLGKLRTFIEAMNGELVIAARFGDGVEVPIRLSEEDDAA